MDGTNTNYSQTTELYVKKVLAGNIEDVRRRIETSMESLGYDIIEEEPNIIGRRGAKGWGIWFASADALDYPATLTVRFKSLSDSSTRVTFDYSIKHPTLNKGDRDVVVQEAKTIASISKVHAIEKTCSVCETESTDDSRFCRRCGAPLTGEQAELEVLRMMAETRAAKTSVVASSITMTVSTIVILVAFILSNAELIKPKLVPLLFFLGGLGILFSMMSSFFGWNRLKRALEKPEAQVQHIPVRDIPASLETGEFDALPPSRTAPASVTEGTTNLLDEELSNSREREKVPVSRGRRDTNEF